ncbi:MAG: hypothetical protein OXT09_12230 [Myxococcales bacterium]|nr:hypothetical protein [Myxococcales bacterium]
MTAAIGEDDVREVYIAERDPCIGHARTPILPVPPGSTAGRARPSTRAVLRAHLAP